MLPSEVARPSSSGGSPGGRPADPHAPIRSSSPTVTSHRSSPFTSVRYAERRRWRSGRLVVVGLAVVLVLAVVGVASLWVYAATSLSGVPVTELARADDGAENTLLVVRAEDGTAGTIAVVQSTPERDGPAVLVFPADLRVQVLGEGTRRLGDFLADGGVSMLVDAVQRFTDDGDGRIVGLDHYVTVDLGALRELLVELGGVPDCDDPATDELCGRLSPDAALAALAPAGDASDDAPERFAAAHRVLRNAVHELRERASVLRPLETKRLIDRYVAAIGTDVDLGPRSFDRLAEGVVATPASAVDVRVVPGVREGDVVRAEPEQAQTLFAAFADPSTPLPADTGTAAPLELTPANVAVRVLNGAGVSGLAAEVAEFLSGKGFAIESTDNADVFDPNAVTVVAHTAGGLERAELVAGYFPSATLREVAELPDGVDVVVTVGGDWSSA